MATASNGLAWSSKEYPLFEPVHQMAIDNVLKGLVSAANLQILKDQQIIVDKDQQATESFEHSMTGVEKGETPPIQKPIFIKKTEIFTQSSLAEAIAFKKAGSESAAFSALGNAIHSLEDATSPAHEGFQSWYYNESWFSIAAHLKKERKYPDASTQAKYSANLQGSVQWAYDIYTEKVAMPKNFFDPNGTLQLPATYPWK